jgi:RNA polymerase sigma-70 factor (ECF subfamily)
MIKAGKIIDFTLVYNLYKKPLYNYVWKMVNNKSLTEDIIQNVFLKLFENLSAIKNNSNPENWIFITARNEVFGYLRKKKIRNENYMDDNFECDSGANINDGIELSEIKDLIEKEIENMDEDSKEIFVLREYSGLSYHEIAHILGVEEGIVKGRLFRARQRLIDKISKLVR